MIINGKEVDELLLNKNFRVTFEPNKEMYKPYLLPRKRRKTVSFTKLHEFVGEKKANRIIISCLAMKDQKRRFRVQNIGLVDVYCV